MRRIFFLAFLSASLIGILVFLTRGEQKSSFQQDTLPYVLAEKQETELPSRKWIVYSIEISKKERLSQPHAARLFSYVASLYADVLEKTGSAQQASLATTRLINKFFPQYTDSTTTLFESLYKERRGLSGQAREVLEQYLRRSEEDNSNLVWDETLPPQADWYIRDNEIDSGAMAGNWKTWIIDPNSIDISPPPKGIKDRIEGEKAKYTAGSHTVDDEETIFFWDGVDNFYQRPPNKIPLAGIWQNVLFVEIGDSTDDANYAKYQKLLTQTIADALIFSWRTKYTFFGARPSMRIPSLNQTLKDPPYPGYISEYGTASVSAATLLSVLFPEKQGLWQALSEDSINSRLLAGVEFEADAVAGRRAGALIGQAAIKKFLPQKGLSTDTKLSGQNGLSVIRDAFSLAVAWLRDRPRQALAAVDRVVGARPAFVDVAREVGLEEHFDIGASWADYNNDGYLDLLTSSGLYKNIKGERFVRAETPTLLRGPGFFGDFDNDGCVDVYIVRSGPSDSLDSLGEPDVLYKNDCSGSFVDVTEQARVRDSYHGVSAAWADFNNDGWLDVYVVNRGVLLAQEFAGPDKTPYRFEPNILYRNNGDGTFTDVTQEAGVTGLLDCPSYREDPAAQALGVKIPFQPVWFDYNNDNKADLFVLMDTFMSALYKNNGDGTFTDVTEEAGLCGPGREANMGAAIGDYNNDGWLDIYVTDTGSNYFWRNNGDGTFTNIIEEAGADELGYGWGTEALDYDSDGYLDVVVVNGNNRIPAKGYYVPNLKRNDLDELFKNNGDDTFTPVGAKEGLAGNDVKFSAAVADYNNDGFPDVFIPTNGERHSSATSRLYKNRGNRNHWLVVQLVGTESNLDAVGARITVEAGGRRQIREIINAASYISQSSPWPIFGLGNNREIERLEVRWPSGLVQEFEKIKANQKIIIREGEERVAYDNAYAK